jgi:hypothetical protein
MHSSYGALVEFLTHYPKVQDSNSGSDKMTKNTTFLGCHDIQHNGTLHGNKMQTLSVAISTVILGAIWLSAENNHNSSDHYAEVCYAELINYTNSSECYYYDFNSSDYFAVCLSVIYGYCNS